MLEIFVGAEIKHGRRNSTWGKFFPHLHVDI